MRILIDIDGILCNTLPAWLDEIQRQTRGVIKPTIEDLKVYEMEKCPPLDQVDPKIIFGILQNNYWTLNLPPMPYAGKSLRKLMDAGHEVYLVTARSGSEHVVETFEWLKKHFPFVDIRRQLIFCHEKHLIEADVLIDDRPQTLVDYARYHPKATLMAIKYPYNAHLATGGQMPGGRRVELFGDDYHDRSTVWGEMVGYISRLDQEKE